MLAVMFAPPWLLLLSDRPVFNVRPSGNRGPTLRRLLSVTWCQHSFSIPPHKVVVARLVQLFTHASCSWSLVWLAHMPANFKGLSKELPPEGGRERKRKSLLEFTTTKKKKKSIGELGSMVRAYPVIVGTSPWEGRKLAPKVFSTVL